MTNSTYNRQFANLALVLISFFFFCAFVERVDGRVDNHQCNEASFMCVDRNGVPRCIPNKWKCDGFSDCQNNMDEDQCLYEETNCTANGEIQCGAYQCVTYKSNKLCNNIIDCRGYNGTYVEAEYGVDESLDYCHPFTTSTVTAFKSSMGWQPRTFKDFAQAKTRPMVPLKLTVPPYTQLSTTESFWRSYCSRQVSINYCPRRCALHGLCAPLRINPSRSELEKMKHQFNPPVVGPYTQTVAPAVQHFTVTTPGLNPTESSVQNRNLAISHDILQRLLNGGISNAIEPSQEDAGMPVLPLPPVDDYRASNSLSSESRKKGRRNSDIDPNQMADANAVYDWSDDDASSLALMQRPPTTTGLVALGLVLAAML